MLPEIAVWYVHLQFQKYKQKVGLDKANCSSLSPAAPSPGSLYLFLHFTDVVSEFADVFFLLFKGIQDDAHWRPLQTKSLHFILHFVLEVPKSQRRVDKHQQQRKSDAEHKDHEPSKQRDEEVACQHDHHDEGRGVLLLQPAEHVLIVGCPHKPREHQHHHDASEDHVEGAQEPEIWREKKRRRLSQW